MDVNTSLFVIWNVDLDHEIKLIIFWCEIITALGKPVDPEVNIKYAGVFELT